VAVLVAQAAELRACNSGPLHRASCVRRDSGTKPRPSDTEARHARDVMAGLGAAISRRVGGSDCGVPKFGDEARRVGGEVARGRSEAARRSAVGGRGNKAIGVVPKAEVGRLSVSPRCAPRGSEAGSSLRHSERATPARHRPQRRAGAASRSHIGMESAPSNVTAARA
jgi:hypothetical protein